MTLNLPDTPFTRRDLPALGLTAADLRRLLEAGVVRRVLRGVFCRDDLPDSIRLRAQCVALVTPPHTVIADHTAAWLWQIDGYEPDLMAFSAPVDLMSTAGEPVRRAGVFGGKRALAAEDVVELHGVLVTSPLRTACDLACLRGRRAGLAVLDAFARHFGLGPRDFARILPRYAGRRGVVQLRELVALTDARSESVCESWTRLEIIDAGLPAPELQVWVELPDYGLVRLDLAYPRLKIAVEYDGAEFHGAEHRVRDEARRAALRRAGWCVIVVRREDFTTAAIDGWLNELRAALRERTPAPSRRYARGERRHHARH